MSAEGEPIIMAPTHSYTGASNFELGAQLGLWARRDGCGISCDSSTGFVLPNDPENKAIGIYRPGRRMKKRAGLKQIEGEGPVAGFVLDLKYVRDPLAD